ncbi:MAG: CPBP family intramembrane glutamic endopeptidase [Pirellulaceae bacterium]|nr:CPBP family intramembrane glutamic endopeptidase [Pirellulaceae bacterium]
MSGLALRGVSADPLLPPDWAVVAVALVLPTAVTWLYFVALDGQPEVLQKGAYGVGKTIQFVLPAVWIWLVRHEPMAWPTFAWRDAVVGIAFGLAVLGAMVGLYFFWFQPAGLFDQAAVEARAKLAAFGVSRLGSYIALAAFYSIGHSLLEEYYWRWFVFRQLARGVTLPAAIAISSLGFMAHHVLVLGKFFGYDSPLTWLFSAGVAIGGAVWAWLYAKSGSLLGPWLSHAVVDATIFVIGWNLVRPA